MELVITLYFPNGKHETHHVYASTHEELAHLTAELVTNAGECAYVLNSLD